MLSETPLASIVEAFAAPILARLTRRVISKLRGMDQALLSGDERLQNAWEEICVQVQGEQSFFWEAYEDTIRQCAQTEVTKLQPHERQSLWLQTESGAEWLFEEENSESEVPHSDDDIIEYLLNDHILPAASDYSNPRIRKYLDGDEEW